MGRSVRQMWPFGGSCRSYRKLIRSSVDGDLEEREAQALSLHLEACAACRGEMAKASAGEALVRRLVAEAAPLEGPDPGFVDRVVHRIREGASAAGDARLSVRRPRRRSVALRRQVWVPAAIGALVLALWGAHRVWLDERDAPAVAAQERQELEQIHASLQDMEAELDGLFRNWN